MGRGRDGGRGIGRGRHRVHGDRGCGGVTGGREPNCVKNINIFKETTNEMQDNVFQCYGDSLDNQEITKTMEVLVGYIEKTMELPKDIVSLCKSMN